MTMTSISPTPEPRYTNGRLVVSEQEAYDIDEAIADLRIRLVKARGELLDEFGPGEAVRFYDDRLRRLKRIRKRLERLSDEKEWGLSDVGIGDAEEE